VVRHLDGAKWCDQLTQAPLSAYTVRMIDTSRPMTPSERVRRANAALVARGGQRMPSGYLQPCDAQALRELVASGYAASQVGAICKALQDARVKQQNQG